MRRPDGSQYVSNSGIWSLFWWMGCQLLDEAWLIMNLPKKSINTFSEQDEFAEINLVVQQSIPESKRTPLHFANSVANL